MALDNTAKTVVAEDVEIVGTIKCGSNIQLDGKLNGDLNCAGNAVIGTTASVKGNIAANSLSVLGQVSGNIAVKDRVELKASATVTGDIKAKRMTVEDGVTLLGKSEVNPSGSLGSRSYAPESKPPVHEIAPAVSDMSEENIENVNVLKEEIRKNVKEEVKTKASGSFFGRK